MYKSVYTTPITSSKSCDQDNYWAALISNPVWYKTPKITQKFVICANKVL